MATVRYLSAACCNNKTFRQPLTHRQRLCKHRTAFIKNMSNHAIIRPDPVFQHKSPQIRLRCGQWYISEGMIRIQSLIKSLLRNWDTINSAAKIKKERKGKEKNPVSAIFEACRHRKEPENVYSQPEYLISKFFPLFATFTS